MAFISIDNVSITGISCAVPKHKSEISNTKFSLTTGVYEKRIVTNDICTSDLCLSAATKLIEDLNINKDDIEILIFVSQTSDYKLPVTSTILQNKLELSQKCICFDIPLGCSGYTYGLSVISSLISNGKFKKGLLLVGDTISKTVNITDTNTEPLFGDAGSATLLEYDIDAHSMLFGLGSDGSGYNSIIIPGGGYRNPSESDKLVLNGIDVFNFGISKIPKVVTEFLNNFNLSIDSINLFIFHQANKFMNDKIYKKLNIPISKTLSSIESFGNTSSATIPLTLITNKNSIDKDTTLLFCGFGVGLSWGTSYIHLHKTLHCSKLIEI